MRRTLVPYLAVLLPFAALVWRFDFVCDDAFISFRYARNLAEGHGARFNLGVEPPVEGYTDFLWVVWISLFERLGVDPRIASRVTTVLAGAVLLQRVVSFAAKRAPAGHARSAAFVAGLFLAVQPTVAVWATGGLGTMVFALTIFLTFEALFGGDPRAEPAPRAVAAGAWALVTALSRADGLFWIGLLLASAFVTDPRRRRAALAAGAIAAAGVLAHLGWRWVTYEDLVPNTAHAKVGLSVMSLERGAKYVLSYFATVPAVPLALVLATAAALRRGAGAAPRVAVVAAAGTFAYAALVGGDFMAMGRFFLPALPFLALGIADAGLVARRAALLSAAVVGLSLPAAFDVHPVPRGAREALHFRWSQPYETEVEMWRGMRDRAREWTYLGRALAIHTEPDESVVLSAIGAAGYYSNRFVFDRHGLVSREVARSPESAPPGRRSPGHDRQVFWNFFADERPTYANASFHRADDRPRRGGREETRVVPLDPARGFPEGSVLVLRLPRRP